MIQTTTSSGALAVGTTTVATGPAKVTAVTLKPAAAACSVSITDGASGTVIAELAGLANGASVVLPLVCPVAANTSIVVIVAGTAATAVVHYQLGN